MYLLDTNVVSELRRKTKANKGVKAFFSAAGNNETPLYLSVITIGELRRGVELIRHRGDHKQATRLESWLDEITAQYQNNILDFTETRSPGLGTSACSSP